MKSNRRKEISILCTSYKEVYSIVKVNHFLFAVKTNFESIILN